MVQRFLLKRHQLFSNELQYVGDIFLTGKKVCVKPLRTRIEAIQRLNPPCTPKGCRCFAEVHNFLSLFCSDLHKLLKPIYDLTRKGRIFQWASE